MATVKIEFASGEIPIPGHRISYSIKDGSGAHVATSAGDGDDITHEIVAPLIEVKQLQDTFDPASSSS